MANSNLDPAIKAAIITAAGQIVAAAVARGTIALSPPNHNEVIDAMETLVTLLQDRLPRALELE